MATHPPPRRYLILPARMSDLEEIMEIERLSFRAPWSRQVFIDELDREWAHVEVVKEKEGGPVLGFLNYWLVHDEVHVLNLASHPEQRRKGHASRLLSHLVESSRRQGSRYITLEVRRSNHGAIRLYRKFGFRPVGIRPQYYLEDAEDAIVMLAELVQMP